MKKDRWRRLDISWTLRHTWSLMTDWLLFWSLLSLSLGLGAAVHLAHLYKWCDWVELAEVSEQYREIICHLESSKVLLGCHEIPSYCGVSPFSSVWGSGPPWGFGASAGPVSEVAGSFSLVHVLWDRLQGAMGGQVGNEVVADFLLLDRPGVLSAPHLPKILVLST